MCTRYTLICVLLIKKKKKKMRYLRESDIIYLVLCGKKKERILYIKIKMSKSYMTIVFFR